MTVDAILTMIRHLPREARYSVLLDWRRQNAPEGAVEGPEPDPDAVERWEMRQWASLEKELAAGQLNTLNSLLRFAPQWKKTPPESDVVGPVSWWPEEQVRKRDKRLRKDKREKSVESPSVGDVMAAFGWSGT